MVWTRGRSSEVRRSGETGEGRAESAARGEARGQVKLTVVLADLEELGDDVLRRQTHLLDVELLLQRSRRRLRRLRRDHDDGDRDGRLRGLERGGISVTRRNAG